MRAFWPLFKRELFAFFVTPLAWVLICVFLVVQGMHFFLLVDNFSRQADAASDQTLVQAFFGNTVLLYVVILLFLPHGFFFLGDPIPRIETAEHDPGHQ